MRFELTRHMALVSKTSVSAVPPQRQNLGDLNLFESSLGGRVRTCTNVPRPRRATYQMVLTQQNPSVLTPSHPSGFLKTKSLPGVLRITINGDSVCCGRIDRKIVDEHRCNPKMVPAAFGCGGANMLFTKFF